MFVRAKKSGRYEYLQVVQNERVDGRVRQRVIATLGRVDQLQQEGHIDALLSSCSRFAQNVAVMDAHKRGALPPVETIKIGPPLVFERLWREQKIKDVLGQLLRGRKYEFPVERAIFMTVLHRLFVSGSDRAAEVWCRGYKIDGIDDLELHHLYRAMAWLGEELPSDQQGGATPFAPRCTKDLIEERLFAERRDLFSSLSMVFFDTTSVYFEGEGGETLGAHGLSKDHRPDRKQMVIGVILDEQGRPICCEMWPGNTTDVKTLIPVVDRLRGKFNIERICIVADRGMISKFAIAALRKSVRSVSYILGVRMRAVKRVRETVLADEKPFETVYGPRKTSKDPSPLKVKEVVVGFGALHRVPQRGAGEERQSRPRGDRREPQGQAQRFRQSPGGQQGIPQVPEDQRGQTLRDQYREDQERDPLRREMGAADGPERELERGGLAVQGSVDGGGVLPQPQVDHGEPPHLSQVR